MYLTTLAKDERIVLKRMHVHLYSSKYSKKTYTIHQHLLCLSIKEVQKQSYRDCRDFLDEFDNLQKVLGLTKVPHYTTPQKCLQRFPPRWYRFLLKQLTLIVKSRASKYITNRQINVSCRMHADTPTCRYQPYTYSEMLDKKKKYRRYVINRDKQEIKRRGKIGGGR